jgi:dTMP kinase
MFITFEGPDGSGKSTQSKLLAERLIALGRPVLCTREPGGTEIGEQIRRLLHDLRNREMDPRAEILLFSAARAQLVAQRIQPHLAAGGMVVCDRYADSTLAYQGYGHQLDLPALCQITAFATQNLKPDLTLLLDLDAEVGLRRRQSGGDEWNRMDDYELAFHRRVRDGYRSLARQEPQRWVILDATRDRAALQAEVWEVVRARLKG